MNDYISRQPDVTDINVGSFENKIHAMFDHIWDCEIEHPVFQDTVGDLMRAVIQCYNRLPKAQPEDIRINLNEPIKVKLTEWGKEIFYHQYDRVNEIIGREVCKPRLPKEDENGYTEFQLWEFIELYGTHIGMTLPNVIEPLEIVYGARREERRDDG